MTATATAPTASATGHSMSGMNMGGGCKISMLWNWNTVGACMPSLFFRPFLLLFPRILNKIKERRCARPLLSSLMLLGVKKMSGGRRGGKVVDGKLANALCVYAGFISSQWRITSKSVFAGSCIGVILLVMSLEFLRRMTREYDRYVMAERMRYMRRLGRSSPSSNNGLVEEVAESTNSADHQADGKTGLMARRSGLKAETATGESKGMGVMMIRPTLIQQLIRAGLHMITFAVAYFVMLLAMYYNGYFIICILIGAFIGAFIFSWETVGAGNR